MNQLFIDECEKFILLLKGRGHSKDLRKYDLDKWYDSAFTTVARPLGVMKGKEEYQNWKARCFDKLKEMIENLLKRLSPNGALSIKDELERIANSCGVPFGIVQKIFGILLKYIITNYYGDKGYFDSQKVAEKFPWVKDKAFVKSLPIPIDGIVLESLKQEGANLKITIPQPKINGRAWSRMNKKDWLDVQAEVQKLAEQNETFPFEYEMKVLWNK